MARKNFILLLIVGSLLALSVLPASAQDRWVGASTDWVTEPLECGTASSGDILATVEAAIEDAMDQADEAMEAADEAMEEASDALDMAGDMLSMTEEAEETEEMAETEDAAMGGYD